MNGGDTSRRRDGSEAIFTTGREKRKHARPKGYAAWQPQAATRALLEQVDAVLDEYADHLPLTCRQVFYGLVGRFDYEKSERAYDRLSEHLARARRARRIPFDVIRDDGVVTYSSPWYKDQSDFWNDTGRRIKGYLRDRQQGQPIRVELWCEAAGMAPQLTHVADGYSVPVFSAGGFASLTAVRLIADRALTRTVPTVLLYAGDFDPSGESIFDSITADAAAFVHEDRAVLSIDLISRKIALTAEQVAAFRLPTAPAKKTDSRSRDWEGETCQLEALPPDALAEIVHDAIRDVLDLDKWQEQVLLEFDDEVALWRGLPAGTEGSQ